MGNAAFARPSSNPRLLAIARGACVTTIGAVLALFAIGTPVMVDQMQHICSGPNCYRWQVSPSLAAHLAQSGLSLQLNAAYTIAINAFYLLGFCLIAAIIIARRPDEPMALFGAFALVTFGASFDNSVVAVSTLPSPFWSWTYPILSYCGWSSIFIFFYVFPDGRFVPRWTLLVSAGWLIYEALARLSPQTWGFNTTRSDALRAAPPSGGLFGLLVLLFFLILIIAQAYRYARISGPVERQQTKWVVWGFIAAFGGLAFVIIVGSSVVGPAAGSFLDSAVGNLVGQAVFGAILLLLPASFAVAILRYRLYDIDVLINRTLVYGSLTVSLAGLYIGGVIGLQALLRTIAGQSSDLAIVISTLAIAALFNPWRRRLQRFVDRRFYRRKYDAARTLSGFSARLRDNVELEQLTGEIVTVIENTVQPSSVAVWLTEPQS